MKNPRSIRIQQRLLHELHITPDGPNWTAVICEQPIADEMLSFLVNDPESEASGISFFSERLGGNLGVRFEIGLQYDTLKQLSHEFVTSLSQERLHEIENHRNQSFTQINHPAL